MRLKLLHLWTAVAVIVFNHAVPLNRMDSEGNSLHLDQRNVTAFDREFSSVCVIDDVLYQTGEEVPPTSPCERCTCQPPTVSCLPVQCDFKPNCKALKMSDECCTVYQCECEHNGRVYQNGERLETPENSCDVCYCRGGEVSCTSIECYKRDDCEPQYVAGRCCPKYDHCPPIDQQRPQYVSQQRIGLLDLDNEASEDVTAKAVPTDSTTNINENEIEEEGSGTTPPSDGSTRSAEENTVSSDSENIPGTSYTVQQSSDETKTEPSSRAREYSTDSDHTENAVDLTTELNSRTRDDSISNELTESSVDFTTELSSRARDHSTDSDQTESSIFTTEVSLRARHHGIDSDHTENGVQFTTEPSSRSGDDSTDIVHTESTVDLTTVPSSSETGFDHTQTSSDLATEPTSRARDDSTDSDQTDSSPDFTTELSARARHHGTDSDHTETTEDFTTELISRARHHGTDNDHTETTEDFTTEPSSRVKHHVTDNDYTETTEDFTTDPSSRATDHGTDLTTELSSSGTEHNTNSDHTELTTVSYNDSENGLPVLPIESVLVNNVMDVVLATEDQTAINMRILAADTLPTTTEKIRFSGEDLTTLASELQEVTVTTGTIPTDSNLVNQEQEQEGTTQSVTDETKTQQPAEGSGEVLVRLAPSDSESHEQTTGFLFLTDSTDSTANDITTNPSTDTTSNPNNEELVASTLSSNQTELNEVTTLSQDPERSIFGSIPVRNNSTQSDVD